MYFMFPLILAVNNFFFDVMNKFWGNKKSKFQFEFNIERKKKQFYTGSAFLIKGSANSNQIYSGQKFITKAEN